MLNIFGEKITEKTEKQLERELDIACSSDGLLIGLQPTPGSLGSVNGELHGRIRSNKVFQNFSILF